VYANALFRRTELIEWYWALTMVMGGFMTLVVLGVPIVFAFFAVNIVGT